MRYVSTFSGIEAATLSWHPLGWEALRFVEAMREHLPRYYEMLVA